jgi:plasmid maintenance system antidote protein VapI
MATRAKTLSEQLRAAILSAPVSRYRMAKEAGVSEAVLSRFVNGETGLRMAIADRLAVYFKLELRKVGDK